MSLITMECELLEIFWNILGRWVQRAPLLSWTKIQSWLNRVYKLPCSAKSRNTCCGSKMFLKNCGNICFSEEKFSSATFVACAPKRGSIWEKCFPVCGNLRMKAGGERWGAALYTGYVCGDSRELILFWLFSRDSIFRYFSIAKGSLTEHVFAYVAPFSRGNGWDFWVIPIGFSASHRGGCIRWLSSGAFIR